MRIGDLSRFNTVRDGYKAIYWGIYLTAIEKKKFQSISEVPREDLKLTDLEQRVFNYFNKGETMMLKDLSEYTDEQIAFYRKMYGESYLSALEKLDQIAKLGITSNNMEELRPEFRLNHNESAAIRLEEAYPGLLSQGSSLTLHK